MAAGSADRNWDCLRPAQKTIRNGAKRHLDCLGFDWFFSFETRFFEGFQEVSRRKKFHPRLASQQSRIERRVQCERPPKTPKTTAATRSRLASAGRCSPLGPVGIWGNLHKRCDQAQQRLMFRSIRLVAEEGHQINM